MLDLTREEKIVLIFITASFLVGSCVNFYTKRYGKPEIVQSAHVSSEPYPDDGRININTADINGLISVKGIGVKTAERIVEYRQVHGPFFYKDDIMKVKGIGEGKFKAIERYITTQ